MILTERTTIAPDETTGQLHDRLADMGARVLVDTLARIESGTAPRTPQPTEGASYAGRIDKIDGAIDWSRPADQVHNRIRAMTPAPGATGVLDGQPVLVAGSRLVEPTSHMPATVHVDSSTTPGGESVLPGTVLAVTRDALRVATGHGAIDIHDIRPAGGKTMSAAAYARGRGIAPGSLFAAPPATPLAGPGARGGQR